jgi:hypothetical protein
MADGPDWRLDNDKKTITITFPTEPPMSCKLQTPLVDDLLRAVGMLRAHMLPEHRYEDLTHTKNESVNDPRWATGTELLSGDIVLNIRDPRYGTLSFLLPRERAGELGQILVRLASAPRPAPPLGKAS